MRGWRNWQTRTFEVRVVYPWGFESPPSHQKASRFLTCLFSMSSIFFRFFFIRSISPDCPAAKPLHNTFFQRLYVKALCTVFCKKCTTAACQFPHKPTLSLITLYHSAKKPVNTSPGRFVSFQGRFTQICSAFAA